MFNAKMAIPAITVPRDIANWSDGHIERVDSLVQLLKSDEINWFQKREAARKAKTALHDISLLLQACSGKGIAVLKRKEYGELPVFQHDLLVDYRRIEAVLNNR